MNAPHDPLLTPLLAFLDDNGYQDLRVLADGSIVGTVDLLFTRAVCMDLDWWGVGQRWCYEDRALARQACQALVSGNDTPLAGFVASRQRPARALRDTPL